MQNFRTQIDIVALAKGVPDVRTLRQELEKLAKAADNVAKPRKVGLDLSSLTSQLNAATPGVNSLISSLNSLGSAFRSQANVARSSANAQVTALRDIQAQMQRYIQMANQASAASARLKVPAVPTTASSLGSNLTAGIGLAAAGTAAYRGTKSIVDTGIELQGVKATLTAANNNDQEKAAKDYTYLTEQALKWGASLKAIGKEYANIKIAAELSGKAQGFSAESTQQVTKGLFESLMKFKTAMGKSDAEVSLVTKAFTDMLSKGTVASEELKKQLGNQMPGAFALGAKALGLTTTQLMDKLKDGAINAYQFVALMTDQINATYGAAAEKHSQDMQASLTRVGVSWDLLKNRVGEAGLFEAVAKSANELSHYLASPEGQANARALGLALKDIASSLITATKEAATFYREHKDGIDTIAQFVAIFGGLGLAIRAVSALLVGLFGPLVTLAGHLATVSAKIGPLNVALTGSWTAMQAAITAAGGFGSAMIALGSKLMGSPYAALFAVANLIKQIRDGMNFAKLGERIGSYKQGLTEDPDKLKGQIADLKKAIAEDEGSFFANGARLIAKGGYADKRLAGMKADLANYEAMLARYNQGQVVRDFVSANDNTSTLVQGFDPSLRDTVFAPGKPKKAKGGGGASGLGETARIGTAEVSAAKAQLKRELADINGELAKNAISYDAYVDKVKQAYANELNAQVAALDKQLANVKDPARRKAIKDEKIKELTDSYLASISTLETQTDEKRKKLFDDILGIESALAAATGDSTSKSLADIEKKYSDTMARMVANGETKGIEALKKLISVEFAIDRLKELDKALATVKSGEDLGQAELRLKVADGSVNTYEAESKSLELKKDAARLNLVLYQQQLDIADAMAKTATTEAQTLQAQSLQLAALQKIADAKTTLADKTKLQKDVEDQVSTGMADAVMQVNKGIKAVGKSMSDMLVNVRNSINKMIADDLAQSFKKAVFGGGGSGGSMGGLLSSLGGFLVDGAMSLFGGGYSSGSLFSTNAEAAVTTGMEKFNSVDLASVGGQSMMPSASMVQNFNWSINAVDPNQFRNTQSQLLQDASLKMR